MKARQHQRAPPLVSSVLPEHLRQLGYDAIDRLQRYLRQVLTENGSEDPDLATNPRLLDMFKNLGIGEWTAVILEGMEFKSVSSFLNRIACCVKKNPILVTFAAQVASTPGCGNEFFPPQSDDRDEDIKHAFFTTVFLDATVNYLLWERASRGVPCRMRQISMILRERRNRSDWRSFCTPFEQVKLASIDSVMTDLMIPRKEGENANTPFSRDGTTLSLNILEAVAQDLLNGFPDNASCGVELMMACVQRPAVNGLGNGLNEEVRIDGSPTGVWAQKPPLPLEWSNVYSAWNMAFVTGNFADWPIYLAKLIAPAVLDAESKHVGLYMSVRVVTLWLAVNLNVLGQRRSRCNVNWRNVSLTSLFGILNRSAGCEFRLTVERTIATHYVNLAERRKAQRSLRADFEKLWMLLQLLCLATKANDEGGMNLTALRTLKPQITAMVSDYEEPNGSHMEHPLRDSFWRDHHDLLIEKATDEATPCQQRQDARSSRPYRSPRFPCLELRMIQILGTVITVVGQFA